MQFNKTNLTKTSVHITDNKLVKTNGFLCNDIECIHIDLNLVLILKLKYQRLILKAIHQDISKINILRYQHHFNKVHR